MQEIPVIDFSLFENDKSTCAREIKSASESVGFFYLRNHGISDTLINEMFSLSQKYFSLPINEKLLHKINEENQGYSRMHQEILDPKNQKIAFAIALEISETEGGRNWFASRHSYDRKSAPIIPGCILINLGDLLEFWTKGLLKSTKHRVVFRSDTCKFDRYSIAYFCHAVDDEPVIPIPSNLLAINDGNKIGENDSSNIITAGQHLRKRLDETYIYF
ncbi:9159_t:CDS:2 [Ambispora leptoticha]|uniref:9159_t:CDS:1 n=1 Tax=Ambispora leptoticha TaxID=144679 RepID=A0A9N9FQJ1_9GLOM|nr:9159_t:CDS:2 [Ambispora leptoticha]